MFSIAEFYESNHLLILIFLIVFTILIIYKKNQKIKELIINVAEMNFKIAEFEAIRTNQISKTIKLGSLVRLKYVLTGEIINISISENENIKFKNNTDIIRINFKSPLAIALLGKQEGDKIKFKKNLLDEVEVYVMILDVNNGFNSNTENVIFENNDLETIIDLEYIENNVQPSKNNETKKFNINLNQDMKSIHKEIIFSYLVLGWSHRKIEINILKIESPVKGGGYRAMEILHSYDIKGEKKSILQGRDFKNELNNATGNYKRAIELLLS